MYFNAPHLLNEDGSVTIEISPSTWHVYNISPGTYHVFNWDDFVDSEMQYINDKYGLDLELYDFDWSVDYPKVVRSLSRKCADWIAQVLEDWGVPVLNYKVTDSWSPREYNFQSDGFTMRITLDPQSLITQTEDFDVYAWASEHYRSRDGFLSFVTSRMGDPKYVAEYDAAFRIEYLLDREYREDEWRYYVSEGLEEVYYEFTHISPDPNED